MSLLYKTILVFLPIKNPLKKNQQRVWQMDVEKLPVKGSLVSAVADVAALVRQVDIIPGVLIVTGTGELLLLPFTHGHSHEGKAKHSNYRNADQKRHEINHSVPLAITCQSNDSQPIIENKSSFHSNGTFLKTILLFAKACRRNPTAIGRRKKDSTLQIKVQKRKNIPYWNVLLYSISIAYFFKKVNNYRII